MVIELDVIVNMVTRQSKIYTRRMVEKVAMLVVVVTVEVVVI